MTTGFALRRDGAGRGGVGLVEVGSDRLMHLRIADAAARLRLYLADTASLLRVLISASSSCRHFVQTPAITHRVLQPSLAPPPVHHLLTALLLPLSAVHCHTLPSPLCSVPPSICSFCLFGFFFCQGASAHSQKWVLTAPPKISSPFHSHRHLFFVPFPCR